MFTIKKHPRCFLVSTNICCRTTRNPCPYCPKIDSTGIVTSSVTERTYHTPQEGSCGHNNLVYLVICTLCSKTYEGETSNIINQRFYDHSYDINNQKDPTSAPPSAKKKPLTPIARHFTTGTIH